MRTVLVSGGGEHMERELVLYMVRSYAGSD